MPPHRQRSLHLPSSRPLRRSLSGSEARPPPASLNLQIPSLHDGTLLEARITVPDADCLPHPFARRAAVVAHPYAPLGGDYDDFVVTRVAALLVRAGWVVAVFNFRGAGKSKGRTSWTGKPEAADYRSVATYLLSFIRALPPPPLASSPRVYTPAPSTSRVTMLFAGYSYGALITAHLPPTSALESLLASPPPGAFAGAILAAAACAHRWWATHSHAASSRTSYSGARPRPQSLDVPRGAVPECAADVEEEAGTGETAAVETRYLLISPPLPPVAGFLLLGGRGGESLLTPGTLEKRGCRMLAVWGDEDVFTGWKKYRRWSQKMAGEGYVGVEVEGAGHFWGDAVRELEGVVARWVLLDQARGQSGGDAGAEGRDAKSSFVRVGGEAVRVAG